ncbi:MAG: hypothetical protein D3924_19620, partial [Candidatus Electrothrix sp. AR4]|nr:hypothetical protein [Candidatus Electrothrix sp. AR4]
MEKNHFSYPLLDVSQPFCFLETISFVKIYKWIFFEYIPIDLFLFKNQVISRSIQLETPDDYKNTRRPSPACLDRINA